jgi:hypothetical protein
MKSFKNIQSAVFARAGNERDQPLHHAEQNNLAGWAHTSVCFGRTHTKACGAMIDARVRVLLAAL